MPIPNPFNFPVVVTAAGMQPQDPTSIRAQIQAAAIALSPGITTDLPGTLVEDILSTDTPAVALCDQARVELVNSLTPYGANEALLGQLGQIYIGQAQPGQPTNTAVLVVFAYATPGLVINNGWLVGDSANVYQVQGGGVIKSTGLSSPITAIAVAPNSTFGVPANTVTNILSSVPAGLTVNNPTAGTPGGAVETWSSFRARILQSGLAASVGTGRYIKTLIGKLLGAQANLISVQQASGGLRIVVGGAADTFEIANVIYNSVADISTLQGHAAGGSNVTVSLIDTPDAVNVLYVASPAQTVTMAITWNTVLTNFTQGSAFASLVQGPLAAYINALGIGQVINVQVLKALFQQAVQASIDPEFLTRLVFAVSINSTVTAPASGTDAISGDPESSFTCNPSSITVAQG
jgi:hypothetical protein